MITAEIKQANNKLKKTWRYEGGASSLQCCQNKSVRIAKQ